MACALRRDRVFYAKSYSAIYKRCYSRYALSTQTILSETKETGTYR
ncbi:MAG: hypothetical protein P8X89_15055 [Reinekea sp.]|jgi:hypothetical protein